MSLRDDVQSLTSAHYSLSPELRQAADFDVLCKGHQQAHRQSSHRGHVNAHPAFWGIISSTCF